MKREGEGGRERERKREGGREREEERGRDAHHNGHVTRRHQICLRVLDDQMEELQQLTRKKVRRRGENKV